MVVAVHVPTPIHANRVRVRVMHWVRVTMADWRKRFVVVVVVVKKIRVVGSLVVRSAEGVGDDVTVRVRVRERRTVLSVGELGTRTGSHAGGASG